MTTVDSTTPGDTTPSGLTFPWLPSRSTGPVPGHPAAPGRYSGHPHGQDRTPVPGQPCTGVHTALRLDSALCPVRTPRGNLCLPDLLLTFADPGVAGVEIHQVAVTAFSLNAGDPADLVTWLEHHYVPHPVRRPHRGPGEPDELITGLILPESVLSPTCLPLMVRIRWAISWTVSIGRLVAERSQTIALRE